MLLDFVDDCLVNIIANKRVYVCYPSYITGCFTSSAKYNNVIIIQLKCQLFQGTISGQDFLLQIFNNNNNYSA